MLNLKNSFYFFLSIFTQNVSVPGLWLMLALCLYHNCCSYFSYNISYNGPSLGYNSLDIAMI